MLINTNGMAIFGPGSEWFWSMAQFLVVVVTLVGIYRQLRAQGAANALHRMEALQGLYQSDRMEYTKLALALDLKYEPVSDHTFAMTGTLLNFFVDLENLRDEGYITLKEIALNWGRPLQVWSALLAPVVERQREIQGLPDLFDMHKLIGELRHWEAKHGMPLMPLDQSELAGKLDFVIQQHTAHMRLDQAWKSGVIPTPPPSVVVAQEPS